MKAGVLNYCSSLRNENKSEETSNLEIGIERAESAVNAVTTRFLKENGLPVLNYPVVLKREGQFGGTAIAISSNGSERK